ncbi:MAG: divergent polysaccharide deacetylase family protein [Gammaproteobacteria bacterium]
MALIVDDLGNRRSDAIRVPALPGPVACAVLPGTPYAERVAHACADAGKPVMLHLPMESLDGAADPGPGTLVVGAARADIRRRLDLALASVPRVAGVNNHMGSAFTSRVAHTWWLMDALAAKGLWFVDSYTALSSVAMPVAAMAGVPARRRDVFLDHDRAPAAIGRAWQRLLQTAHRQGSALGIAHPYPETLETLERLLPQLAAGGFSLVSPADMMDETHAGETPWPVYSSPWPTASKKSRP